MNVSQVIQSLELRDLRYFIAVVEAGSLSKAADKIGGISQPYLTKQIKALERKLKVKLFDRTKRPHELNQAGKVLLVEARSILYKLNQAAHTIQSIDRGKSGYLKVGFTSAMANGIFPTILGKFEAKYPDVKLILSEENTVTQIQRLRERVTDIMFFYEDCRLLAAEDLKVMPIHQEMLVVVLPESHRLAERSSIALSELQDEEFIMPDPQIVPGLSARIDELFKEVRVVPNITQRAVFMVTILGLVAGEIGISILPDTVQNLQRQGVVYRPLAEQKTADRLSVLSRSNDSSQIVENFLKIAKEISAIA